MKISIQELAIGARFKLLDCDETEANLQAKWDGKSLGSKTWVLLDKAPKSLFSSGHGLIQEWKGPLENKLVSTCSIVSEPKNLSNYKVWCIDFD